MAERVGARAGRPVAWGSFLSQEEQVFCPWKLGGSEESVLAEPLETGSSGRTCCSFTSPRSVRAGCLLLSTAQDVLGAATFKCVCVYTYTLVCPRKTKEGIN